LNSYGRKCNHETGAEGKQKGKWRQNGTKEEREGQIERKRHKGQKEKGTRK
jgi:hypothetical protein